MEFKGIKHHRRKATWSILIPTTPNRSESLKKLKAELNRQIKSINATKYIKIDTEEDNFDKSIGEKRNILVNRTNTDYLSFIDSDDMVSSNYVELLYNAIQLRPDCVGIRMLVTWSGQNPAIIEHSIKHNRIARRSPELIIKPVAHLNPIRTEIAKQVPFPHINYGEDTKFAYALINSKLLKNEIFIDSEEVYLYQFDEPNSDSLKYRNKF